LLAEVEKKISRTKFNMTAACSVAWLSLSYIGWWGRVRADERATQRRARDSYDNIAVFRVRDGVEIANHASPLKYHFPTRVE